MGKVFISYSSKDKPFVSWLVTRLRENNIDVWYDQSEITIGDSINEKVKKGIKACSSLIVVLSKSAINSKWVSYELNSALLFNAEKEGVKIFPILIEPTEVPLALQSIRYADFTVNPELALRELIEAIRIREKNVYEIPDWKELTPSVFENLVYDLLVKEGFKVLKQTSQTRDQGFDFIARITKELPGSVPTKEKWLVQAKLYKHSKVNIQAIAQLYGYSKLANADGFLLVTNSSISTSARSFIKDNIKDVKVLVWDQSFLNDMLMKHGDTHRKYFGSKIMDSNEMVTIVDPELHKIQQMISKLKNCPEGMPGWREYEDICVEVLDYLFVPPLRKPKIQKRTESGLDVRDAIYPNRCDQGNWRYIREDYDAKYILFEFKNYATTEGGLEIDKKVVNQVRIYLK